MFGRRRGRADPPPGRNADPRLAMARRRLPRSSHFGSVSCHTASVSRNIGVAQILDQALTLEDRVSTAFYFRKITPAAPELVDVVEQQATERVHAADIDRALPLAFPRSGYLRLCTCSCGVSLFAVRYGILRSLDLQQPLARITFDTFRTPPKVEAASSKKSVVQEHLEKQLQQLGLSTDDLQQEPEKTGEKPNQTNVEAVADEPGGNQKGVPGKGPNPAAEGTEQSKSDEQSSGEQAGESKDEGAGQPSASQKGQQASKNSAQDTSEECRR